MAVIAAAVMRLHPKWWPLAAFLGAWQDVDHLFFVLDQTDPGWLLRRGTFHNLFVITLVPSLAAAVVVLGGWSTPERRRALLAVPLLQLGQTLVDLFHLATWEPYGGVALWYPLSRAHWVLDMRTLTSPVWWFDATTLVLSSAVLLGLAGLLLRGPILGRANTRAKWLSVAAYVLAFAVVVPLALTLAAVRT